MIYNKLQKEAIIANPARLIQEKQTKATLDSGSPQSLRSFAMPPFYYPGNLF